MNDMATRWNEHDVNPKLMRLIHSPSNAEK